jgi:hypothetical protein
LKEDEEEEKEDEKGRGSSIVRFGNIAIFDEVYLAIFGNAKFGA